MTVAWDVQRLASDSVRTFGEAVARLVDADPRTVVVDDALVMGWFRQTLRPVGWTLPSPWDPVAGDYRAADGWIRLHTNAPRHRAAALRVLGVEADRDAVARTVERWEADALEVAVVEAGGAAATMRPAEAWSRRPQGAAVATEPLVARDRTDSAAPSGGPSGPRPLDGVRVLDITRVLAGPVATRVLAALGATVLRIDPPDWDEPALVPDMTLGKRAARIDAHTADGARRLRALLAGADVLVHGYRRDALASIGLGEDERRALRPGLVEATLTAYGWTGPWSGRRGFDSLVQMSAGIAERGMRLAGADRPVPLPVQALDHATGWLLAAAAVDGLRLRREEGVGSIAHLSLARTARELVPAELPEPVAAAGPTSRIATAWGPADLLSWPLSIEGVDLRFDAGPAPLGSAAASWEA